MFFLKFFCDVENEHEIILYGENAHHLTKVLRSKLGDTVTVCDGRGKDYTCKITAFENNKVRLCILCTNTSTAELDYELVLYQCLPKGEKWDFILQKSVELGVTKIVPVLSKFCVTRLAPTEFEKKRERYEKIIISAAKQSGRGKIPQLASLVDIRRAITEITKYELPILCYENSQENLRNLLRQKSNIKSVGVLIGSEGGFSEDEIAFATDLNLCPYSLGNRILRTETAAIAVLSTVSIIL